MLIYYFYAAIILAVIALFIKGCPKDRMFMLIVLLFVGFYYSLDFIYPYIKDSIWLYRVMDFYETHFIG